ncbi:MAG: hypothetical protein AAB919_00190 [Patescibacteria group bacterium]
MQAYEKFLATQQRKYDGIRAAGSKVRAQGLRLDPALTARNGCASIALSHPAPIAQSAEEFSRAIAGAVPALVYTAKDIHTTLCSGKTTADFFPRRRAGELRRELYGLARVAVSVLESLQPGGVRINFTDYIHTDAVAMMAGRPDKGYVGLICGLVEAAKKAGLEVYPAIDAHVTVSRFTADVSGDKLDAFLELMRRAPPGVSVPEILHVGYSHWDAESPDTTNGHFSPYYSFRFSAF